MAAEGKALMEILTFVLGWLAIGYGYHFHALWLCILGALLVVLGFVGIVVSGGREID